VLIGVDASGKFLTGPEYQPAVAAAAVGPTTAFEDIEAWTKDSLGRWELSGQLTELHANELKTSEMRETCQMLNARRDIRLAAIATDSLLLNSAAALEHHRRRQLAKACSSSARTEAGVQRRRQVLKLLENPGLVDGDYAFAATLPLLSAAVLQRAFGYFAGDEHRGEMDGFDLLVDKEAGPTIRYVEGTLLATIGGDGRFHLTTPDHWHEQPVHPLVTAAMHEDGNGLKPRALLRGLRWVESVDEPSVPVADIAAWVIRRAMLRPEESETRELFELLRPLLAGEKGEAFGLFSISRLRPDQKAMYAHLRDGIQPAWWLQPRMRPPTGANSPPLCFRENE
jgi:hypothetical protein